MTAAGSRRGTTGAKRSVLRSVSVALYNAAAAAALSCFVAGISAAVFLVAACVAALIFAPGSAATWALLAFALFVTFVPLWERNGPPADAFMRFCCFSAGDYFSIRVLVESGAEYSAARSYVVGLEPHSALPTAIPAVFGLQSPLLPEGLRGRTHGLASSICFRVPFVRHMYHWLGIRPITAATMKRLLGAGRCGVLVPGGVQECLHMQRGRETAVLTPRRGFIRLAMRTGADVVPCFAFGQSDSYAWARLGPPLVNHGTVTAISRRLGMVPMMIYGRWGTPVPIPAPMTVVFGRPLGLPQHDDPPEELVQHYLDAFIAAMRDMFEKNKAAAGYPNYQFVVL